MTILKFGGTSVSSIKSIETICHLIKTRQKERPIVVVSALSGVTDLLVAAAAAPKKSMSSIKKIYSIHYTLIDQVFADRETRNTLRAYVDSTLLAATKDLKRGRPSLKLRDKLSAYGEMMSSRIITEALRRAGVHAEQVLATELIVTTDTFGSAEFIPELTRKRTSARLKPLIARSMVPVITGFIGATKKGETTTLGRGGSDYSAAILGYAINAKEIEIWTDVDGVFTADPRLVKKAQLLKKVSYREASELATFGAKVLHPRTIRPATAAGIPVRVRNTFNPRSAGTLILDTFTSQRPITAISSKKALILATIYSTDMLLSKGFLARVFEIFARHGVSIDLVSVSEVSISLTCDTAEGLSAIVREISRFAHITISKEFGMVSLIGSGVANSANTIEHIFRILKERRILVRMVSLGAASINVSLVVKKSDVEPAVRVLHDKMITKARV